MHERNYLDEKKISCGNFFVRQTDLRNLKLLSFILHRGAAVENVSKEIFRAFKF